MKHVVTEILGKSCRSLRCIFSGKCTEAQRGDSGNNQDNTKAYGIGEIVLLQSHVNNHGHKEWNQYLHDNLEGYQKSGSAEKPFYILVPTLTVFLS